MSDKPIPESGARDLASIAREIVEAAAVGHIHNPHPCSLCIDTAHNVMARRLRAAPPQGETPPPEHVFVACWCDPMCCDIGKEGCHADKGSDYCRLPRNMHAAPPPERGRAAHKYIPCDSECDNKGCHHVQGHAEPCGLPREAHSAGAEPPEGQAAGRLREIQTSLACLAAIMETPKDAAAVESLYASLVNWPGWKAIPPSATTEPPTLSEYCGPCQDGNVPVEGPNGYMWHEYSGDDPVPCAGLGRPILGLKMPMIVKDRVKPPATTDEGAACPVCGNEVRTPAGYLQCECPAPLSQESTMPNIGATTEPPGCPHHRPYPAECPHCKAAFIAGIDAAVAPPRSQGIGATTDEGAAELRDRLWWAYKELHMDWRGRVVDGAIALARRSDLLDMILPALRSAESRGRAQGLREGLERALDIVLNTVPHHDVNGCHVSARIESRLRIALSLPKPTQRRT